MKIYIVRHGQTDWNKARRIQGQVDIPLNEFGRHLARETARGLRDVRFDAASQARCPGRRRRRRSSWPAGMCRSSTSPGWRRCPLACMRGSAAQATTGAAGEFPPLF